MPFIPQLKINIGIYVKCCLIMIQTLLSQRQLEANL